MASCPTPIRDAFRRDLGTAQAEARASVVPKRSRRKDAHWKKWEAYCAAHGFDPYLRGTPQAARVSILQVYATRLRSGKLAPSNRSIKAGTVEDYLRTVGEEISFLGTDVDPRFTAQGLRVVALKNQATSYSKADPPPEKVKPIPIPLVRHTVSNLQADDFSQATADLLIVGFFYLLRPGEHCFNADNNKPFRLRDVSFRIPDVCPPTQNAATVDLSLLDRATHVLLTFTNQKNGRKGEAVTHGTTPDPMLCPLRAVARRVTHLRRNAAPADTPLHTVIAPSGNRRIGATHLSTALRQSCRAIGPSLGLRGNHISARALRAGGAMALLRAGVDSTETRIIGRWKSWAMLEYLHQSAFDTTTFATRMLTGGDYVLSEHAVLPDDVASRL